MKYLAGVLLLAVAAVVASLYSQTSYHGAKSAPGAVIDFSTAGSFLGNNLNLAGGLYVGSAGAAGCVHFMDDTAAHDYVECAPSVGQSLSTTKPANVPPYVGSPIISTIAGVQSFGNPLMTLLGSNMASATIAANHVLSFSGPFINTFSATGSLRSFPVQAPCKLRDFQVNTVNSQPGDGALTITVQVSGTDSAMVITVPSGAAAGPKVEDTPHTVPVSAQSVGFKWDNASPGTISAQIGAVVITCGN